MSDLFVIEFPGTEFEPLHVEQGARLCSVLSAVNSPILFGCRSGICGTCLVEVGAEMGEGAGEDELEALEIFAPGNAKARLACQMCVTGPLVLRKIESC